MKIQSESLVNTNNYLAVGDLQLSVRKLQLPLSFFLTHCAALRLLNNNYKKLSCCWDSRSYCVRCTV